MRKIKKRPFYIMYTSSVSLILAPFVAHATSESVGSEIHYAAIFNGKLYSIYRAQSKKFIKKSHRSQQLSGDNQTTVAASPTNMEIKPVDNRLADDINTIIVTGSNIRGVDKPAGGQLITIDRKDIQQSGFSTIRDIAENLPQNFGSGANGEMQPNLESGNNLARGTTFNLRGLGQTATLNLINGRRVPSGGASAAVSDISTVPLVAIERVEVLPDGASAVYGSDAVSGVVNIILRSDFEGHETTARYGFTTQRDNLDEFLISHVSGAIWDSGNILLSYEFYHRDQLLRKDRPYSASRDLRAFGGGDYRTPIGNPGVILTPSGGFTPLYTLPPDQNGLNLTHADLLPPNADSYYNIVANSPIFPRKQQNSLFGYLSQDIVSEVKFHAEGRYTHRKNRQPFGTVNTITVIPKNNPYWFDAYGTGDPVRVAYSLADNYLPIQNIKVNSYSITAGFDIYHFSNWMTRPYISFSRDKVRSLSGTFSNQGFINASNSSNPETALNPFGDGPVNGPGVIALIRDESRSRINARTLQANVVSDGPLLKIFNQTIRGALGADFRKEKFDLISRRNTTPDFALSFNRKVYAVFGELRAPLVDNGNVMPGIEDLELSFSIRYDHYKDAATRPNRFTRPSQSTTNPRIGLIWSPIGGIQFTGSYGTSFRAPQLDTLASIPSVDVGFYADTHSSSGRSYVLAMTGVDENIKNETAKTWSLGAEINPLVAPQLRAQINYFKIDFRDQVGALTNITAMLSDAAAAELITRNPSTEQVLAACNTAAPGRGPSDSLVCMTGRGVDAIVDTRTTNLARTKIDGLDIQASYTLKSHNIGQITLSLNSTLIFSFKQAVTENAPEIQRKSTATYPVNFRTRGNISWSPIEPLNFSLFVNYINDYHDPVSGKTIDAWTTIDFTLNYTINTNLRSKLLDGVTFQLIVQNLFDQDPPFYDSSVAYGYDYANSDPTGRFVAISIRKPW